MRYIDTVHKIRRVGAIGGLATTNIANRMLLLRKRYCLLDFYTKRIGLRILYFFSPWSKHF